MFYTGRGCDTFDGKLGVFDGSWEHGEMHDNGIFYFSHGEVEYGKFQNGVRSGISIRWSADRRKAWKFIDGKRMEQLSLEVAAQEVDRIGLSSKMSKALPAQPREDIIARASHPTSLVQAKTTVNFPDGSRYVGAIENGHPEDRSGTARLYFAENVYQGQFTDGRQEGQGILHHADGSTYKGNFRSGLKDGRGTFWYIDGDCYMGEFRAGHREGLGTYFFPDGAFLCSAYTAGDPKGPGVWWSPDRNKAARLFDGQLIQRQSLEDAASLAKRIGFEGVVRIDGYGTMLPLSDSGQTLLPELEGTVGSLNSSVPQAAPPLPPPALDETQDPLQLSVPAAPSSPPNSRSPTPLPPEPRDEVCICGNVFMKDAVYCRKCGRERPQVKVCICGNVYMEDSLYCRICGRGRALALEKQRAASARQAGELKDLEERVAAQKVTDDSHSGSKVSGKEKEQETIMDERDAARKAAEEEAAAERAAEEKRQAEFARSAERAAAREAAEEKAAEIEGVQLSEEQLAKIRTLFDKIDVEKTGTIKAKEFEPSLDELNVTISDSGCNRLFTSLDLHSSSKLQFWEYLRLVKLAMKEEAEAIKSEPEASVELTDRQLFKLRTLFNEIDSGHSGTIDVKEFRLGMQALGLPMNNDACESLFASIDSGGGGMLSFEEWTEFMKQAMKQESSKKPQTAETRNSSKKPASAMSGSSFRSAFQNVQLREQQLSKVRSVFDASADDNGTVAARELLTAMRALGMPITEDKSKAVFVVFDLKQESRVQFEEYVSLIKWAIKDREEASALAGTRD
jgi:Ca2+-binding EF-hand superfamily protein